LSRNFQLGGPFGSLLRGLALLVAGSMTCAAQRYSFREYTQGLGNLNIASLAQDRTGFLWVGTQNGLYRYDGGQFQAFGDAQGIPERLIQSLYVGLDGTLWVASSTGIFFEESEGRFKQVRPAAGGQFVPRTGTIFAANKPDEVVAVVESGAVVFHKTGDGWAPTHMQLDGGDVRSDDPDHAGPAAHRAGDLLGLFGGRDPRMRAGVEAPFVLAVALGGELRVDRGQRWRRKIALVDPLVVQGDILERLRRHAEILRQHLGRSVGDPIGQQQSVEFG